MMMAVVSDRVSVDAALASLLSELECFSLLKEEQRMTVKISLMEKMFSLFSQLTLVRV